MVPKILQSVLELQFSDWLNQFIQKIVKDEMLFSSSCPLFFLNNSRNTVSAASF
jgi:hypothetical protein